MNRLTVQSHYLGEAGRQYHQVKRGIPPAAFDWIARLRAEKMKGHITPAHVVFEYGCGAGWNLAALNCARRIGFDVSDFLAEEVRGRGIEFFADPELVGDRSVDVLICHHTLEHVIDPAAALNSFRKYLKPGGKLLLFVPFEKEKRYRRYNPSEPNHHLFSWNAQTLGNLAADCGYEIESAGIGEFGYDRFAAAFAVKYKVGERGFRFIRKLAHLLKPASEVRLVAVPRPAK